MILAVQDSGGTTAGPIGLLVVLLIGVATVLLIRNMNGRLKRLPKEFPDPPAKGAATPDPVPGDESASGPTAGA